MHTIEEWFHKSFSEPVKIAIEENINGKVITGIGAGREGSGTTMSLYQLSLRLAQHNANQKICMVDFNLAEPSLDSYFLSNASKMMHIDNVYKQINTEITSSMLENNLVVSKVQDNLFLLPGTRRPFSADSFHAEVLMAMIAALKHIFDIVVVDVSSHFDNPGTVSGLLASDEVLVFSNYDLNGLKIYNLYHSTLFKHYPDVMNKLKMIGVNNRNAKNEELKHLTQTPIIKELNYMPELHQDIELKGKHKEKYMRNMYGILKELHLIEEDIEIDEGRRVKWIWPFQRSSNSNA